MKVFVGFICLKSSKNLICRVINPSCDHEILRVIIRDYADLFFGRQNKQGVVVLVGAVCNRTKLTPPGLCGYKPHLRMHKIKSE